MFFYILHKSVEVISEIFLKLGIRTTLAENEITVHKGTLRAPTEPLSGHNDHRIVMSCATLLTLVGGTVEGAEAVRKSLPEYFGLLASLGAICEEA